MKVILFFIILIIPFSVSANTLISKTIGGKEIKVIKYETNSKFYDIKIGVTNDATSLRDIMLQNNAISGVNGVFECPKDYTRCGGKSYTINERYVKGEKISTYKSTGDRVVFGWDKNIAPFLFQTGKINPDREGEIYEGFANFPLLLQKGKLKTEYYYEVGLIDKKMLTKGTRNFICSDKTGKNIYFGYVYNVTLDEAGLILIKLGCYNALNLDAGLSKAFIYNMQYLSGPGREILDGVFIVPKNINFKEKKKEIKSIINLILKKLEKFTKKKKVIILDKLILMLDKYYEKLYKKHSIPLFEKLDGELVKVGQKTEFKNELLIEKIYTINMLRHYLYKIKETIKSTF
ncbi:hypothetical protein CSA08_02080 [Candidatus Gracilibacteria bacterium]|nr:MAG: hypothetical protein CSA08_02080 [Candidatus Gracilibacteria bacterium]